MVLITFIAFVGTIVIRSSMADTVNGAIYSSSSDESPIGGTSVSPSFQNITSAGRATGAKILTGNSYRSYPGFVPSLVTIIDNNVAFMDESPSATEWQNTNNVTAMITVETNGGNSFSSVQYRISNSGSDESGFFPWQTDVTTTTVFSGNKIRFAATLPNTSGQSLSETDSNYIQWQVRTSGSVSAYSGKYKISVRQNDSPAITIIQPDKKGGYASDLPLIQAFITDQYWGVDTNTIQINIDRDTGENDLTLISADKPAVFDASKNLLSYKHDGAPLINDRMYTLTITATDNNGKTGQASVSFRAKSGAIADLVPYPSPFDPKVQPVVIRYILNKGAEVSLNIYDMAGRLVRTVINNQSREPGISEEQWDGNNYAEENLANGVYICEIVAKDEDGEHRRYCSLAILGK